ncbi:MAG: YceI family protein [Saprospiraceae bacterium]|nr:YceI family protein [Lewinellaceae bacterium]
MQRVSKQIFPILLIISSFFSCQNDQQPEPAPPATLPPLDTIRVVPVSSVNAAVYIVNDGVVNWLGKRAIGNRHTGTIQIKEGQLSASQGQLLSGNVVLDMRSLSVNNVKDPGAKSDLESHLKDSDFFEVKKYPTGTFVIDEVLPSKTPDFNWIVSGELTLKGKTNRVNIPVKMTITDKEINAESANFVINRTQWGINFQSGLLGTTKDKLIEDIVPISLTIRAERKEEKK